MTALPPAGFRRPPPLGALAACGAVKRGQLHPTRNRWIGAVCDEELRNLRAAATRNFCEWRVAGFSLVTGIHVGTGIEEHRRNLDGLRNDGVVERSSPDLVDFVQRRPPDASNRRTASASPSWMA
jgi:hypothetical protein